MNIRQDFPVLQKDIIYMDNACMALRPIQVIDAINSYYKEYPACAGRSYHKLGKKVTEEVDKAREELRRFFNAKSHNEIVFTKNTTEAINLVAYSLDIQGKILTTDREHNSNLIPWQSKSHAVVPSKQDFTFDLDKFQELLDGVKLVSMVHTSNLDGYTTPAKEIIKIAHDHGALVMLDCAQSAPHKRIDVRKLDVDFIACSGHKMMGPSGIGCLYGKAHLLEEMKPFMLGGDTVEDSTYDSHKMLPAPEKFEAGLQHYAGIIGFGAAVKYLKKVGMENIAEHENKLNQFVTDNLKDYVDIVGVKDAALRSGIFNFNIKNMDPHNIAIMLDESRNIMIRSGQHCVHSWYNAQGIDNSARASLYLYNTLEECRVFIDTVKELASFGL